MQQHGSGPNLIRGTSVWRRLAGTGERTSVAAHDWETDERGDLILFPLVEHEVALFHGTAICLRLVTADRSLDVATPLSSAQMAMTPAQARTLAVALTQAADRIEQPLPADKARPMSATRGEASRRKHRD
jgi:hypothetical protein